MIIVMKPDAKKEQVEKLQEELIHEGMTVQLNEGVQCTVLGIIGCRSPSKRATANSITTIR